MTSAPHEQPPAGIEFFCYGCKGKRTATRVVLVAPRTYKKGFAGSPRLAARCPVCGTGMWRAIKRELVPETMKPPEVIEGDPTLSQPPLP